MHGMKIIVPPQITGAFKMRSGDADKYSVGTVAVVGGSDRYANAPVMAGLGARVAGAGLVSLVVPAVSRLAASALVPEATFARLTPNCIPPRADVVAMGMGLGVDTNSEIVVSRLLSGSSGKFVLDADALTILAGWYGKRDGYEPAEKQELILTPHEGEAARLLNKRREEVSANRLACAKEIASRYGATVVLKGANSIVVPPDLGRVYENNTGNPFMALGGMGDLLAGMIAARWAYLKCDAFTAAASAVWLHGLAADCLVAKAADFSVVSTAAQAGALRVLLDSGRNELQSGG